MSDLLTVYEVAAQLRVHHATVRRWIEDGELGAQRLGPRSIRIARAELERFLAARTTHAADAEAVA